MYDMFRTEPVPDEPAMLGRTATYTLVAAAVLLAFGIAWVLAWAASFLGGRGVLGFWILVAGIWLALIGPLGMCAVARRHGWRWLAPVLGVVFLAALVWRLWPDCPSCGSASLVDGVFAGAMVAGLAATLLAALTTGPVARLIAWAARRWRGRAG